MDEEVQEDDSLESRKMRMQAYYKSGQRVSRREFLRNGGLGETRKQLGLDKAGEKKKGDFSRTDFFFMMGIAGFYDLLSALLNLIPFIGGVFSSVLVTPVALLNLYIMYSKRGISFKSTKSVMKFGGASLIEFIPVLNFLPGFMLNVVLNYPPPIVKNTLNKAKIN